MVCWQNTAFSKQHYQDLHAASRKEIQDLDEEAGPLPLGQQAVDCKNGRTSLFQHEWFTNTVPEMLAKRSVRGCPSWSRSRCSSSNSIIISSSGRRHSTRPSLSLCLSDVSFSLSLWGPRDVTRWEVIATWPPTPSLWDDGVCRVEGVVLSQFSLEHRLFIYGWADGRISVFRNFVSEWRDTQVSINSISLTAAAAQQPHVQTVSSVF